MIHCAIICSFLSVSAELKPVLVEADVIAFNNGADGWTQVTIQEYFASIGVTVSLPA